MRWILTGRGGDVRGVSLARSFTVWAIALSIFLPYPCSCAGMPLCAQWSGGCVCDLTYLSGAFMFTARHRCRRDDALRRLGKQQQTVVKEGRSDRVIIVKARVQVGA